MCFLLQSQKSAVKPHLRQIIFHYFQCNLTLEVVTPSPVEISLKLIDIVPKFCL